MNATVWTLCFPRAMELWRDRCAVQNFCPPFYRQQTLFSLQMTRRQCDQDMSHLVPLARRKRSTLTLHFPHFYISPREKVWSCEAPLDRTSLEQGCIRFSHIRPA